MATNSNIEWCKHTANLWFGCSKVHVEYDNCYALAFSKRFGHDVWGNDKPRKMIVDVWGKIKKYQKDAEKLGEIHRVFVGSMQDIFEKPMPLIDQKGKPLLEGECEFWNTGQLRDKFFNEVVPNSPNLMFLLLTKRPSNINKYIPESWKTNPPENVMFGTSPVNQETAEKLIVQLSKVNGNRFLSIEPQLEKIDLMAKVNDGTERALIDTVDWVINGGESGHHKRPFDADWARTIRDDCKAKGVPFFFKQIDKIQAIPEDLMIREFPEITNNLKINKKMKQSIRLFEFSAIVKNFDELRISIEENKFDAIFHSGMILYDKIELDKLCNDNKENLTVYEDNGTSIFYFRFGEKEHYEFMPFALSLKELKRRVENMIRPRVYTHKEIKRNFRKSKKKLAKIFPRTDNYESLN